MTPSTTKGQAAYSERLRKTICEAGKGREPGHLVAQLRMALGSYTNTRQPVAVFLQAGRDDFDSLGGESDENYSPSLVEKTLKQLQN